MRAGVYTYACVDVSRRIRVGVGDHGDDAHHDGGHRVDGQPALLGPVVAEGVLARLVQDRDAHVALLVHCKGIVVKIEASRKDYPRFPYDMVQQVMCGD